MSYEGNQGEWYTKAFLKKTYSCVCLVRIISKLKEGDIACFFYVVRDYSIVFKLYYF